jgi:hypothetical protein
MWRVAGGAVVGGGVVWAVLRFGVPVFLTDEHHPVRPPLEALSWIAGIGGLVVAVVRCWWRRVKDVTTPLSGR